MKDPLKSHRTALRKVAKARPDSWSLRAHVRLACEQMRNFAKDPRNKGLQAQMIKTLAGIEQIIKDGGEYIPEHHAPVRKRRS